jgi:hypothetical protein
VRCCCVDSLPVTVVLPLRFVDLLTIGGYVTGRFCCCLLGAYVYGCSGDCHICPHLFVVGVVGWFRCVAIV